MEVAKVAYRVLIALSGSLGQTTLDQMLEKLAITRISVAVELDIEYFQRSRFQFSLLPVGKKLDLQVPRGSSVGFWPHKLSAQCLDRILVDILSHLSQCMYLRMSSLLASPEPRLTTVNEIKNGGV